MILKAAGWDQNPMHWDRSVAIVKELLKQVPVRKEMTAMEFGAGTGHYKLPAERPYQRDHDAGQFG